jgi:YesN/AraC family two-component response regulator
MKQMTLYIQNMVSLRCKLFVKQELINLGLKFNSLELGEVHLDKKITPEEFQALKIALHKSGLELMDDNNSIIVEKIKNIIVEMIHYTDELPQINFSDYLTEKLEQDYHSLSELFSKTKGITIEHFIIMHKIERVKELIIYDELNLTEISYKMHYSSVAHLSNQFKKITGLTPTFFKNLKNKQRNNLESL